MWFFFVAIFDMCRQYRISEILHKIIRVTHLELKSSVRLGVLSGLVAEKERTDLQYKELLKQSNAAFLSNLSTFTTDNAVGSTSSNPIIGGLNNNDELVFSFEVQEKIQRIIPVPRIDLNSADNVYCWLYVRLILQNFGFRVRFRLNMFVGAVLVLVVILQILVLKQVIIASSSKSSTTIHDAMTSVSYFQNMFTISILALFALVLVYFASLVNGEFTMHHGAVASHVLRNKMILHREKRKPSLTAAQTETLIEAIDALDVCISSIEINNAVSPYRVISLFLNRIIVFTLNSAPFRYSE